MFCGCAAIPLAPTDPNLWHLIPARATGEQQQPDGFSAGFQAPAMAVHVNRERQKPSSVLPVNAPRWLPTTLRMPEGLLSHANTPYNRTALQLYMYPPALLLPRAAETVVPRGLSAVRGGLVGPHPGGFLPACGRLSPARGVDTLAGQVHAQSIEVDERLREHRSAENGRMSRVPMSQGPQKTGGRQPFQEALAWLRQLVKQPAVVPPHAQTTSRIPQQCEEAVARIHHSEPALAPIPQHPPVAVLHRAGGNEWPDTSLARLPAVRSNRDASSIRRPTASRQVSLSSRRRNAQNLEAPQCAEAEDPHGVHPLSTGAPAPLGLPPSCAGELLCKEGTEGQPLAMEGAAAKQTVDASLVTPVCNNGPPELSGTRVQRHFLVRRREVRRLSPGMCGT
jgi:hypothetical protein